MDGWSGEGLGGDGGGGDGGEVMREMIGCYRERLKCWWWLMWISSRPMGRLKIDAGDGGGGADGGLDMLPAAG